MIHAELLIKNKSDLVCFRVGQTTEREVRQVNVNAIVDEHIKARLIISEKIQTALGLPLKDKQLLIWSDGYEIFADTTEAVEVRFKNRRTIVCPIILPNFSEVLIGSFLLTDMNLAIDHCQQNLMVVPDNNRSERSYVK